MLVSLSTLKVIVLLLTITLHVYKDQELCMLLVPMSTVVENTGSRSIHVAANDVISLFLWLSDIPLHICTISSLSIPLLMDI